MDECGKFWHFSDMTSPGTLIPVWQLYGERLPFPDVLHIERIADRAAGHDWTIAPHRHLHLHQIFLLTAGEVTMSLDGPPRPLALPVCVNVPRGAVHDFTFSAGTEGYVLTLPAEGFDGLFAADAETAVTLSRPFRIAGAALLPQFRALETAHTGAARFRRTALVAQATAIGCAVAEAAPGATAADGGDGPDPRLLRFEAMVRDRLRDRLSVADFARALGLSPRHLSRLCRAATGQSAQDHADMMVMREACRLLVYTRMSVQQVAWHLGFDDPSYFTRAFRRRTGLSPRAYRARFDDSALRGAAPLPEPAPTPTQPA